MAAAPMRFPVPVQTASYIAPGKEVYYPLLYGLPDLAAQERMNQMIADQVNALIEEQSGYQSGEGMTEMTGLYEIKNNQRGVFSVTQSNYAYTPPMAHGMTILKSLTFDVQKGKQVALAELFRPGSDYVRRLSELIRQQIQERDIPVLMEFTQIDSDQSFYIADKTLVLYFQLYEITPYVYGFPMFPISVYSLQDIVLEDGVLGRMIPGV